jgi:hypothetical protein
LQFFYFIFFEMSDQDRLMGAGGDESQLGRRFDNNEDMEEGLRRVRAFKKRRQFALAQDAVQRIQQSLIQNAPSAGGVVSAEDRLRTQAMLTTVCKSGLAGLQQGSNSSEVIVVQGGMRFTHRESETVEEEKDMENFHILCPQVNSLKQRGTMLPSLVIFSILWILQKHCLSNFPQFLQKFVSSMSV